MSQNYEKEVLSQLKKAKPDCKLNLYNCGTKMLGHSIPQLRELSIKGFSFETQNYQKDEKIWFDIWKSSDIFEVQYLALFFLTQPTSVSLTDLAFQDFKRTFKWLPYLNNWAHSDTISAFYHKGFQQHEKEFKPYLEKWNQSKNSWLRRQSILPIYYYINKNRSYPKYSFAKKLFDSLKFDPYYYVQKAVGWTIRESYKLYPVETLSYIEKNLKHLNPTAYSTSVEKLDPKIRKQFKEQRKVLRSKADAIKLIY